MNGDTKLVLALITRIELKLPCNSGKRLETIEADPLVQQTVSAIVDLSRFRFSTIVKNLTHLLETISKEKIIIHSDERKKRFVHLGIEPTTMVLEDSMPVDILQSQLFVLKIFSACVSHHWKCYRGLQRGELLNGIPKTSQSSVEIKNNSNGHVNRVISRHPSSDAKYILKVLSRFLHQMANQEENLPKDQSIIGVPGAGIPNPGVGSGGGGMVNGGYAVYSTVTYEIVCEIFNYAGRVILYISASNWSVVFSRIKSRIAYLTSTYDEWPETADL
ncbi:2445_t:CDS:2, partial [Ambispora leptoticha]